MRGPQDVALVVLQHGMWGMPADMAYVEATIKARTNPRRVVVLNADVNSARYTYDGVDVLGERLAALVQSFCEKFSASGRRRVWAISFVAYSLGGLIVRYAIGKLAAAGFFATDRDSAQGVIPINFVTFASPHLGSWNYPDSLYHRMYNAVLPYTLSRTGSQLVLADRYVDGLPLLVVMADPRYAFHAGLALFEKRILLASVRHDATVPFWTSSVRWHNPYEHDPGAPVSERHPHASGPLPPHSSSRRRSPPRGRAGRAGAQVSHASGHARRPWLPMWRWGATSQDGHASPSHGTATSGVDSGCGWGALAWPRWRVLGQLPEGHVVVRVWVPDWLCMLLAQPRSWLQHVRWYMTRAAGASPPHNAASQRAQHTQQSQQSQQLQGSAGSELPRSPFRAAATMAAGAGVTATTPMPPATGTQLQPQHGQGRASSGRCGGWWGSHASPTHVGVTGGPDASSSNRGDARGVLPRLLSAARAVFNTGRSSQRPAQGGADASDRSARVDAVPAVPAVHGADTGRARRSTDDTARRCVATATTSHSSIAEASSSAALAAAAAPAAVAATAAATGGEVVLHGASTRAHNALAPRRAHSAPAAVMSALLPAPSSRLRGDVFVAALPLLLVLWVCMLAWLVVQSAQHYMTLLLTKRDDTWDIHWQPQPQPQPLLQLTHTDAHPPTHHNPTHTHHQRTAATDTHPFAQSMHVSSERTPDSPATVLRMPDSQSDMHSQGAPQTHDQSAQHYTSVRVAVTVHGPPAEEHVRVSITVVSEEGAHGGGSMDMASLAGAHDRARLVPTGGSMGHAAHTQHDSSTAAATVAVTAGTAAGSPMQAPVNPASEVTVLSLPPTEVSMGGDTADSVHDGSRGPVIRLTATCGPLLPADRSPHRPSSRAHRNTATATPSTSPARPLLTGLGGLHGLHSPRGLSSGRGGNGGASGVLEGGHAVYCVRMGFIQGLRGYSWPITRYCVRVTRVWVGWVCASIVRVGMDVGERAPLPTPPRTPQRPAAASPRRPAAAAVLATTATPTHGVHSSNTALVPNTPTGTTVITPVTSVLRQVAQQRQMCEHLNLLHWHRVDVDTRHYHAHAAIVVRSAARFAASHGHIVEYAVRQMREL